jgi:hypothetical protein
LQRLVAGLQTGWVSVNDCTVCLRKPSNRPVSPTRVAETSEFQIEVPPRLARELGLSVLTPLQSRVIRCASVARDRR